VEEIMEFKVLHHALNLYGVCKECAKSEK
jgi:Fe2+ or Zn2+ uptake regulation protein